jgi:hypothetical protein
VIKSIVKILIEKNVGTKTLSKQYRDPSSYILKRKLC